MQDISLGSYHPGNLPVSPNFWPQQDLGKIRAGPLGARWKECSSSFQNSLLCEVDASHAVGPEEGPSAV